MVGGKRQSHSFYLERADDLKLSPQTLEFTRQKKERTFYSGKKSKSASFVFYLLNIPTLSK